MDLATRVQMIKGMVGGGGIDVANTAEDHVGRKMAQEMDGKPITTFHWAESAKKR